MNCAERPFVVRIVKEYLDFDYPGEIAVMYVGFNKRIGDADIDRFQQILKDAKEKFLETDPEEDTFELQIREGVNRFNDVLSSENNGIQCAVIDAPFDVVIRL